MDTDLAGLADAIRSVPNDFAGIWSLVSEHAADIVEIRHIPPIPELDGFRTRDSFVGYVIEEGNIFPRAFVDCTVTASVEHEGSKLVWNPLSLSGHLRGSGRHVDIQFLVELHFESGKLTRVVGRQSGATPKADIVEWLRAVQSAGGFNPPMPLPARP